MSKEGQTVFKMKRSAAGSVRREFDKIINTIPLPIDMVFNALIFFFNDEDVIGSWAYALNKLKAKGSLYLTPEMRKEFIRYLAQQSAKKFGEKLDTTSRLLLMGATDQEDYISWFMRFPDCLVSNFKKNGTYGCIEGVPRSGKTSLASSFIKILGENFNFQILTNIKIRDAPSYVTTTSLLSELVVLMDSYDHWVCILDETATFVYKKRALSTENIDFENLARFIGKMGGRLLMITHSFELDVPTQLQTWMTERYKKLSLEKVKVDLAGEYLKMHKVIRGVPDAELQFITEDITSLNFDISIHNLLQRIQQGINVRQAVNEQLRDTSAPLPTEELLKQDPNELTIKELGRLLASGIKGDKYNTVLQAFNNKKAHPLTR